jgi:hypothetical protein
MRKWKTGSVRAGVVALAAGLAAGLATELAAGLIRPSLAAAQDFAQLSLAPLPRRPLIVHVGPAGRLYRQCTDWHVIEHRAAGDTVVPRTRCWWALR